MSTAAKYKPCPTCGRVTMYEYVNPKDRTRRQNCVAPGCKHFKVSPLPKEDPKAKAVATRTRNRIADAEAKLAAYKEWVSGSRAKATSSGGHGADAPGADQPSLFGETGGHHAPPPGQGPDQHGPPGDHGPAGGSGILLQHDGSGDGTEPPDGHGGSQGSP